MVFATELRNVDRLYYIKNKDRAIVAIEGEREGCWELLWVVDRS